MEKDRPSWEGRHYAFFQNIECEYFPCHQVDNPSRFNCLFCYCPLYALGRKCGGLFTYTERGRKDCTNCVIPHVPENYGRITEKYSEIMEVIRREDGDCRDAPKGKTP
ncbi:MAG: cysteine-rich small domain-containing protein [Eubacteriales bacterium]|nr:cysteine-rich small domain-containing protein [Eubacteriales bacterium]